MEAASNRSYRQPSSGRRSEPARMHCAAIAAGSARLVFVKSIKQGRKIVDDAFQYHLNPAHQVIALQAIPFETVFGTRRALVFNHQANAACLGALR
jgi:hypothetical protein